MTPSMQWMRRPVILKIPAKKGSSKETRIFAEDGQARVGAEHGLFFASCLRCVTGLLVVIYRHDGACTAAGYLPHLSAPTNSTRPM
eukprot:14768701-Ditylum_brightwellii.AAC.1